MKNYVELNQETTYKETKKVYLPAHISVADLQAYLGIGKDKAYALVNTPGFPANKIGGTYYVWPDDLEKWLKKDHT